MPSPARADLSTRFARARALVVALLARAAGTSLVGDGSGRDVGWRARA